MAVRLMLSHIWPDSGASDDDLANRAAAEVAEEAARLFNKPEARPVRVRDIPRATPHSQGLSLGQLHMLHREKPPMTSTDLGLLQARFQERRHG